MRFLVRFIIDVLTALSLLMCLGTCALWARSYFAGDSLWWGTSTGEVIVETGRGYLGLSFDRSLSGEQHFRGPVLNRLRYIRFPPLDPPLMVSLYPHIPSHRVDYGPVRWVTADVMPRSWFQSTLALPLLLVAAAPLLIALVGCRLLPRLARRASPGRCIACGYDLTGNTSGVCPECGSPRAP